MKQMVIIINDDKVLIRKTSDALELPNKSDWDLLLSSLDPIYTSNEANIANFTDLNMKLDNGLHFIKIRQVLNQFDSDTLQKIIYYKQLIHYYDKNQFCGSCGNKTIRNKNNKFVSCSLCNHEIYPHIAPCIIVRIQKQDQILMARGIDFPAGVWGLVAGFVEIGESLEDAVIREVKEEVGIEVQNIQYFGSQTWFYPSTSIMVAYTATYKSGEIKIDPLEITDAGFFDRSNVPGYPSSNFSIASKLINDFLHD